MNKSESETTLTSVRSSRSRVASPASRTVASSRLQVRHVVGARSQCLRTTRSPLRRSRTETISAATRPPTSQSSCRLTTVRQQRSLKRGVRPESVSEDVATKEFQHIYSCMEELIKKKAALQKALESTKSAQDTRCRVEDALARCLANAQAVETRWRSHVEEKQKLLSTTVKSQDDVRAKCATLSRQVIQVNADIEVMNQNVHKSQDFFRLSKVKQAEAASLVPVLRVSACNAVNELEDIEQRLETELSAQAGVETLMHFAAKDIRWICRLRNPEGPVNQDIRVALTPPGSIGQGNLQTAQSSVAASDAALSCTRQQAAHLNDQHPLTQGPQYRLSVRFDDRSNVARSSTADLQSEAPILSDHSSSSTVFLPLSGPPVSWLVIQPPRPDEMSAGPPAMYHPTFTSSESHVVEFPVSVPFDRIIEYDATQRPHELLVTDWETLDVPSGSPSPVQDLGSADQPAKRCVTPDAFEHRQVVESVTTVLDEFLDPVVDNITVKPKAVAILSLGTLNSPHLQALWGDEEPHRVTQRPILDLDFTPSVNNQPRNPGRESSERLVGFLESAICTVFDAREKWTNLCNASSSPSAATTSSGNARNQFHIEASIVIAPCATHESSNAQDKTSSSLNKGLLNPVTHSSNPSPLLESSLPHAASAIELLRSIQSQQDVPGMTLQRSGRVVSAASDSTLSVLSPSRFFNKLQPTSSAPLTKVPPLSLAAIQDGSGDSALRLHSDFSREPLSSLSARLHSHSTSASDVPPPPSTARVEKGGCAEEFDLFLMEETLLPPFKRYSCPDAVLAEIKNAVTASCPATSRSPEAHIAVILKVNCPVLNSETLEPPTVLTILLAGLIVPPSAPTKIASINTSSANTMLPRLGDAIVDDVLGEVLRFPRIRQSATGSTAGLLKKAKRGAPVPVGVADVKLFPSLDSSQELSEQWRNCPTSPLGKVFYYFNSLIRHNKTRQRATVKSSGFALKGQTEEPTVPRLAYKGGCLTIITHLEYPCVQGAENYELLKTVRSIMELRTRDSGVFS